MSAMPSIVDALNPSFANAISVATRNFLSVFRARGCCGFEYITRRIQLCQKMVSIRAMPPAMIRISQDPSGIPKKPFGLRNFSARHLTHEFLGSPQAGQGLSGFLVMASPCAAEDKFRLWLCFRGSRRRIFPAVRTVVRIFGAHSPTIRAHHVAVSFEVSRT